MLKQYLLVLVAAGAISIAAPFAAAQDNPPADQSQPSQGHGQWHHGPQDPAERTKELTKKLNLTADQQTKVQDALQSEHSQMESLHQDSSMAQQDRRAKMMDIRKSTDSQIRSVLDANQQKKWDEMQAKREQRMESHRQPNGGSDQQAPPPQQ